jgi:hypothetical protein
LFGRRRYSIQINFYSSEFSTVKIHVPRDSTWMEKKREEVITGN